MCGCKICLFFYFLRFCRWFDAIRPNNLKPAPHYFFIIQNGEETDETGDCADRTCPYEIAWSDYPDETGAHHMYAECANKGICDRTTGQVIEDKIRLSVHNVLSYVATTHMTWAM